MPDTAPPSRYPSPPPSLSRSEVEAALDALAALTDDAGIEAWRTKHLGRKSRLQTALKGLSALDPADRAAAGRALNEAKTRLRAALDRKRAEEEARRLESRPPLDVTLPGRPLPSGRLHPITLTERAIVSSFARMGFSVIEGPEVELDYYNFEALRIPADHPAREAMDTFYLAPGAGRGDAAGPPLLLRTHTSPNQIRFMERNAPPIRLVSPGRTYRNEATDATHEWMITQTEVLAVDRGLTLAHLKGTLYEFARHLFGEDREIRFRCDYFPFVEPGVEVAVSSPGGWIEILGAGMVHPEILERMGFDPEEYTGFAAGLGVERIAMLRHGIDDIRRFYENDLRFLEQFR